MNQQAAELWTANYTEQHSIFFLFTILATFFERCTFVAYKIRYACTHNTTHTDCIITTTRKNESHINYGFPSFTNFFPTSITRIECLRQLISCHKQISVVVSVAAVVAVAVVVVVGDFSISSFNFLHIRCFCTISKLVEKQLSNTNKPRYTQVTGTNWQHAQHTTQNSLFSFPNWFVNYRFIRFSSKIQFVHNKNIKK